MSEGTARKLLQSRADAGSALAIAELERLNIPKPRRLIDVIGLGEALGEAQAQIPNAPVARAPEAVQLMSGSITYRVDFEGIGAPRQSRRDTWNPSPAVKRYRAWKDQLRELIFDPPEHAIRVEVKAFFAMPKSWSEKKKARMFDRPHRQKPDWDNVGKAVCDTLYERDEVFAEGSVSKRWDQKGSMEITIHWNKFESEMRD